MSPAHPYTALLLWQRDPAERFTDNRYSRRHHLRFDGGVELVGSSSPSVVPLPYSDAAGVDPEEMFVAALAACHMLWFLSLAAKGGWVVERYRDDAQGVMTTNASGQLWMSEVTLRPEVAFAPDRQPSPAELDALHHAAHAQCFIANSVRTQVRVVSVRA
jgi:organic hydroperoxide reductase OsmC/OhrA